MELINDSKDSDESLASPKAKGKRFIVDFHIHSKYARATSKDLNIDTLNKWAKIKGLNVIGTGDFQHPKWYEEINKNLKEEDGVLWSKNKFPFLWQTEISLIYSDEKGRRIHYVVLAPNKEVVEQIIEMLGKKGRLDYDGRPIFGITSVEFIELLMEIDEKIEVIPAHCMTPWFAIFGSKSGYDNVEECFKEKSKYVHAIESGMSADPEMLRRVSKWDRLNIVSFSDSHSFYPWRLGREATEFDCGVKYKDIINAIRTKKGLKRTIETWPEYGKYHFDGHRNCKVCFSPNETKQHKGICPKCGRLLTIGVENRIEELADREKGMKENYIKLIPLHELIGVVYNIKLLNSKKVDDVYNLFIKEFGNEFNVLLKVSFEDLKKVDEKVADVVIRCREGKINVKPGYDGEYGRVDLEKKEQKNLMNF